MRRPDSCFYVWINGIFVVFPRYPIPPVKFHITRYLKEGENRLTVLVLKWCDGSYLEDQDKLRMSGIFRDVYVLKHAAAITLSVLISGEMAEVCMETVPFYGNSVLMAGSVCLTRRKKAVWEQSWNETADRGSNTGFIWKTAVVDRRNAPGFIPLRSRPKGMDHRPIWHP